MEGWVSRCKLSYMEWASNRVLLSSTENYILNGKDCETEHRPVKLNHLAVQQQLTQHELNYT